MNRLLYFPTISVPQNSWLRQSLLYWDGISSMVPADFWERPERHNPGMLEMVREGIVKQEPIYPNTRNLPGFEQNFISFLEANPRKPFRQTTGWVRVHVEKIGFGRLGEYLQRIGVAEHKGGMWMLMEPQTADEFMAYLATCVANAGKRKGLVAATDDPRMLELLQGTNARNVNFVQRTDEAILPLPPSNIDLRDVADFRAANKDTLDRFRADVQRRIDRAVLTNPEKAADLFDFELQELTGQAEDIRSQMSRSNWSQVSFGGFTGLGSAILGAEPLLDGSLTTVDGAVSLGLMSAVATTVSGLRSGRVPTGVMAYAVLAGQKFD